jgi:hypothetical protein
MCCGCSTTFPLPSGVPRRRVWGVHHPPPPSLKFRSFDEAEPNFQFRRTYIHNNLIRIRVSPIFKYRGIPDWGATAPRPRSLCPLSSTEFVELPTHRKIILGTPLPLALDQLFNKQKNPNSNAKRDVCMVIFLCLVKIMNYMWRYIKKLKQVS